MDLFVFIFGLTHEDAHVGVNHIFEVLLPRHIKVFIPSGFIDELFEVNHYLCALLDLLDLALNNISLLLEGGSFFTRSCIRHLVAEVLLHEVVLFLGRLQRSEAKVVLHLEEIRRHILQQELKSLEVARLGCDMDSCVSNVVFLKELGDEGVASDELFEGIKSVVFGTNVEDCLPLVVSKIEEVI